MIGLSLILNTITSLQNGIAMGEARVKRFLTKMIWVLALVVIATVLLISAIGFFLFGLFQYMADHMPISSTAFLLSFVSLLFFIVCTLIVKVRK